MKTLKRKPIPNAPSQVQNFNSNSQPNSISIPNDPFAIDWIDEETDSEAPSRALYCGESAKNLREPAKYSHFYPIRNGSFNCFDYQTIQHVLDDLEEIWRFALKENLGIESFKDFALALVLPDSVDRLTEVKYWAFLALKMLGFKAVSFWQESVACAFAAGLISGCILNMGSQTISIACVEEGFLLPESRVTLGFGGDNLTKLLLEFLIDAGFPYESLSMSNCIDYDLITELRRNSLSLVEADTANISMFDFYVRKPDSLNGGILEERESGPNQLEYLTLDHAIIQSLISSNPNGETDKIKKFSSSLLLVGGDCAIPGLADFIQGKIQQQLHQITGVDTVAFTKRPKDMDSRTFPWKGASIYARIEASTEGWITRQELDVFGVKAVRAKVNFSLKA